MHRYGPDAFSWTGNQKDWSIGDSGKNIAIATLLINGVDEGADDGCIEPFRRDIPDVKWVKFERSSHFPQFEERGEYMRVVGEFLIGK